MYSKYSSPKFSCLYFFSRPNKNWDYVCHNSSIELFFPSPDYSLPLNRSADSKIRRKNERGKRSRKNWTRAFTGGRVATRQIRIRFEISSGCRALRPHFPQLGAFAFVQRLNCPQLVYTCDSICICSFFYFILTRRRHAVRKKSAKYSNDFATQSDRSLFF